MMTDDDNSGHGSSRLDQIAVKAIYDSLEQEIDTEHRRTKENTHNAATAPNTAAKSLSMIMEDKSKHFSHDLIPEENLDSEIPAIFETPTKKQHRRSSSSNGRKEGEGIEVSTGGLLSRGYIGLSDIASISTLGNVSRQNGSKGNAVSSIGLRSATAGGGHKELKEGRDYEPNVPHPLLEFPPLYWIFKPYPKVLETIKSIYKFRWHASYPLQRRVVFSQVLRKFNVHMTWGELILVIPLLLTIVGGIVTSAIYPSVSLSGHSARLALIFALLTAIRNSLLTLLIGLPFERALWYHKLAGRLAFVNGILHTYVAHAESIQKAFFQFLVWDVMNASGTGLMLLITVVTITSVPQVRRWWFELFYYAHIISVATMTACAFYHSGILIPILASLWIFDLVCRKAIMACCRYPRKARIRVISDTVVELKFPKCKGFDYNAGQHLSVCVPELDLTFHPFSIASCPRMPWVIVMIRKAGAWTQGLHALAKKEKEVSILVEGPNGSPNVNILDRNRYQSVLLLSGGIGVTPIQSICNQLIYEQSKGHRDLKRIRVVWTDRDPVLVKDVDVVRRSSSRQLQIPRLDLDTENQLHQHHHDLQSLASGSVYKDGDGFATDFASVLLSHFSPSVEPDEQDLGQECDLNGPIKPPRKRRKGGASRGSKPSAGGGCGSAGGDESTFRRAFENPSVQDILELQVHLTTRQPNALPPELAGQPFIHTRRPNIPYILEDMREEALEMGLKRVAVFLCAPARLAVICQNACVKYSDHEFQFDFHMEYQD